MTVRCCPVALYVIYRSRFFSPTPFSLISSGPLLPASVKRGLGCCRCHVSPRLQLLTATREVSRCNIILFTGICQFLDSMQPSPLFMNRFRFCAYEYPLVLSRHSYPTYMYIR